MKDDRRATPILIFIWLIALTVAGAILGLKLAPQPTDLGVNNAAGETLATPSVTTSATQVTTGLGRPSTVHAPSTVVHFPPPYVTNPTPAAGVGGSLTSILERISKVPNWKAVNGGYSYAGTPADFFGEPVPAGATLNVGVRVENGYATGINVHTSAQGVKRTVTFKLTKIGDFEPTQNVIPT